MIPSDSNFTQQKPGIAPGLVSLRANRAVTAVPTALPIHHPETVNYEQFCN